jgi:hypothetical protein
MNNDPQNENPGNVVDVISDSLEIHCMLIYILIMTYIFSRKAFQFYFKMLIFAFTKNLYNSIKYVKKVCLSGNLNILIKLQWEINNKTIIYE